MNINPVIAKQRGFTLIEALFSAIVLAIGLLALAGFHAVALKDGSMVKMRMMATNLAQEKLEDLKGFARKEDDPSTTSVNECASTSCYTTIAANAGGQQSGGSLVLPATSVTVSGTTYTRSWTATCYAAAAGSVPSVTTDCANADYKLAKVKIDWTDNQGTAQSTTLEGVIYGVDPANAARAMANPVPTAGPSVSYTGTGDGSGTALDKGTQKSSKPLPTVSSKGYSLSTSFETVIYDSSNKIVSRQENQTVNCVCEFAGSTGSAYPASYFYWNGSSISVKTPSATVTKTYGTAPSIQGDTQNSLCGVCCRDHHDSEDASVTSTATTALYDPDRPSSDYNSGDHKHYYYSDSNCATNPNASNCDKNAGIQAVTSGYYLESCRMIRVDGIWRVMQDWRLKDMVVMPKDYLNTSSQQTLYDTYKSNEMRYVAYSDCVSAGGTGCTSITQTSAPDKSSMTGRSLSSQAALKYNQLLAYAMYIDRVYKTTAPRTLDADYYTTLKEKIVAYQSDSSKLGWRDIMSFTEPNVTLFATWASDCTSDPAKTGVVTVQNQTIKNIDASAPDYYGVYYRGLTQVQTDTSADDYCGNYAILTAYISPSNSGLNGGAARESYFGFKVYDASTLADLGAASYSNGYYSTYSYYPLALGIDRHDHALSKRKSDSVTISRTSSSSTANATVSGLLTAGNSSASSSLTVTAVSSSGASTSCTVSTTGSTGSFTGTFSCPVGNNWSGTVTITAASGIFFDHSSSTTDFTYDTEKNDGYSSSFTTSTTTVSDSSHQFWIFGPTINVTGTLYSSGQSGNQVSCSDSSSTTCTVSSGSSITASSLTLDSGTHTWTGTVTLSNMTGKTNKIAWPATSANDCTSATTIAKTTTSMTVGPTDGVGSFTFCAK